MELEDKIAVVTNVSEGVGLALATRLVKEGATVIISDVNKKLLKKRSMEIGATAIVANIIIREDIKKLVDTITKKFGRIDLFVWNTGIEGACNIFSSESNNDYWHKNVMSQMYVAKYLLPQMILRGSGYLINSVPVSGLMDEFHLPCYSTMKHEALSFAERLARNYKSDGIKVSVVCQGELKAWDEQEHLYLKEMTRDTERLTDMIVYGIWKEKFMISPIKNISRYLA